MMSMVLDGFLSLMRPFLLPIKPSYRALAAIALAIENHSIKALWYSIIAMLIIITLYDQIFLTIGRLV